MSRLGFHKSFETNYLLLNPDVTGLSCTNKVCEVLPRGVLSLREAKPFCCETDHYFAKIYGGNYLINPSRRRNAGGFFRIIPRKGKKQYSLDKTTALPMYTGFFHFGGNQNLIYGMTNELQL